MKTNDQKARLLAIFAAVLSVVAFALYNVNNLSRDTHPNVSSWIVWAFITILNFTSYKSVTGDWVKSILPTVDSALCVLTAVLAWYTGSFESLSAIDWTCLVLGCIAGLGWFAFKSASFAQVLLQVAIVTGGIPTVIGLMTSPHNEPWVPWFMWTVMFIGQWHIVQLTWGGKKIEFLYPGVAIIFHSLVFLLALKGSVANMHELFGLLSGLFILASALPYIWFMVVGEAKPMRSSWFIWSIVGLALLLSYRDSGARETLWAAIFGFINPTVIFLVSVKYGQGGWTKIDRRCLMGAAVSFVLWKTLDNASWALIASIITDACAIIPIIASIWRDPRDERPHAWFMFGIGSFLNLFAISEWSWTVALYPVYMGFGGWFVAWPLIRFHWFGIGKQLATVH